MNKDKRNIWIFGSTGFIGSALVKMLSVDKQNQLHLLVHKNIPYRYLETHNIFTGNLENFDIKWLKKYPPDIIFHLARIAGSNNLTRYMASVKGYKANQRLATALNRLKISPVIVYVSGSLMYGQLPHGKWADENSTLSPVSYARYYIKGEMPWLEAQNKKILDIRFARPGWIVGPGSWFRVFYWNYYLQTGKIPLYGDGSQVMSLVYIDDCAGQLINLAEKGKKGQNLNIFSGSPVFMETFSKSLAALLKTEIEQNSLLEFRKIYGKTVTEAFNSSTPLTTAYSEIHSLYKNLYSDVDSMLFKTVAILKHEQGIFTKTPEKSLV